MTLTRVFGHMRWHPKLNYISLTAESYQNWLHVITYKPSVR